MSAPDMDVIKEIPGYKVILKAILKSQIQQLVEQLAANTDEESVILTASVSDGTLSHLGSDSGKSFLDDHEDVKSQFLGFCLKKHHKQKLAEKEKEQENERLTQQAALQMSMAASPRMNPNPLPRQRSPRGRFAGNHHHGRTPGPRHEPYPISRPHRINQASDAVNIVSNIPDIATDGTVIPPSIVKHETPVDISAAIQAEMNLSQTQTQGESNDDDSSSSAFPSAGGAPVQSGDAGNDIKSDSGLDPNISVKLEAFNDELEITGLEPGTQQMPPGSELNFASMDQAEYEEYLAQSPATAAHGFKGIRRLDGKYVCSVCGKIASTKQNIEVHIRTHTGEKPYACNICHRQFAQKSNLNSHKIVHMNLTTL